MANLREFSRDNYGPATNNEDLRNGCLQRIADATELMAKNHQSLINDRDQYKRWYEEERQRRGRRDRSINALRGVITKLKKQLVRVK